MKTEQEVIKEIAQLMQNGEIDREKGYIDCSEFNYEVVIKHGIQRLAGAKALYNAGYRKASDVIDEFAEQLKQKFDSYEATYYNGYEGRWHDLAEEIDKVAYGIRIEIGENLNKNTQRKATEKMLAYSKEISEWVAEKLPKTDDFYVIYAYINRNVRSYKERMRECWLDSELELELIDARRDW